MKLFQIFTFLCLLLACPALQAQPQDFLQKAKNHLDAGECDKAQRAYDAYKVEHPKGDAEVERGIKECMNTQKPPRTPVPRPPRGADGLPCPGAATVTDIDDNKYNTVQIGKQCWMKENLRTTRYANGTVITKNYYSSSSSTAYRYYVHNDPTTVSKYGYLYNWSAVMHEVRSSDSNPSGVQGICPDGWHVPSDAEWTELTDYVSSKNEYACGNDHENIAKALAATTAWESNGAHCAVGNNLSNNNTTGFTALPAGCYYSGNYYRNFGTIAQFWSATENDSSRMVWGRIIDKDKFNVSRGYYSKDDGFSVRCLRD